MKATIKFRPLNFSDMVDHDGGSPAEGVLPRRDEDPYDDIDLDDLPDWWREAVEEFRRFGLRPYRPPRFEDGTLKHTVVDHLEDELNADIRFVGVDTRYGDDWTVEVDGKAVGTIPRRRDPDGYTVFEMATDEFRAWLRDQIDAR